MTKMEYAKYTLEGISQARQELADAAARGESKVLVIQPILDRLTSMYAQLDVARIAQALPSEKKVSHLRLVKNDDFLEVEVKKAA